MKVLRDRIAVEVVSNQGPMQSKGGLFLPGSVESEQIVSGTVAFVSDEVENPNLYADAGSVTPMEAEVVVGDTVYFNKFSVPKVKTPEGEFFILKIDDILLVG